MTLYKIEDAGGHVGEYYLVIISEDLVKARRLFLEAYNKRNKDYFANLIAEHEEQTGKTYSNRTVSSYGKLREYGDVKESVHSLDVATYVDHKGLNKLCIEHIN